MNTATINVQLDPVDATLEQGLTDLWFPVLPSTQLKESPIAIRRLGYKIALWRDQTGGVHALEDHCPHRGAPLSMGVILGDRIACPYHGVEVREDGTVTRVPGSPGCKLEGTKATRRFHTVESNGVIFLYNASEPNLETPPPLTLPEQLTSPEWSSFLCYVEWGCDYRYAVDNVMDPMHGAYLHKQSHTMSEGEISAEFQIRDLPHGFIFEKKGQRDVNFDWTEWSEDGNIHTMRLEIPYPKTGGPGGNFTIIGAISPAEKNVSEVFFWRCRKISGWQRDTWRFLYKNRLEERHWNVLEQDRVAVEAMEPNANLREFLYAHDTGIVRLRRRLRGLASAQLERNAA
jgi:phenylpropionate dioxygenase-like ring-hydroxylating dioxygenase large terminal subunit